MQLAQADAGRRFSAADLADGTLSQNGGALVARLADGRIVVVPGFFPHEPSPQPAEMPPGAIVLSVDAYYAAVAGAPGSDDGGGLDDVLASIAPAAAPVASVAEPSPSLIGVRSGSETPDLTSAVQVAALGTAFARADGTLAGGAAFLAGFSGGGGFADSAAPVANVAAGNGSGNPGSPGIIGGSGSGGEVIVGPIVPGGSAPGVSGPGPQPPAGLSGLPFPPANAPAAATIGFAAGATGAAPLAQVVAGSTGGESLDEPRSVGAGHHTIGVSLSAQQRPVFSLDGTPFDEGKSARITVNEFSGSIPGGSTFALANPSLWVALHRERFDDFTGVTLSTDAAGIFRMLSTNLTIALLDAPGAPARDGTALAAASATRYAVLGDNADGTVTIADPRDPNLVLVRGDDQARFRPETIVVSATNQYDFSGLDGRKFVNIDGFDAVNGIASSIVLDRAFLDALSAPGHYLFDPNGPTLTVNGFPFDGFGGIAEFYTVSGDAQDSVSFADPQNWNFVGVTAGGGVQYRAVTIPPNPNFHTPIFVEIVGANAGRPAYNFAGGAGDDPLLLPDMNFGALDGGSGVNTLKIASGSYDFATLAPGQSVSNFSGIDAGADPGANTIVVDHAFVAAATADSLSLFGGANDRALVADLASAWTYAGAFTDAATGTPLRFVQFRAAADGRLLNVQSDLATLFPPLVRSGGAGDDVLAVDATPLAQLVDGGDGFDRLQPMGAGALDLTALAPGSSIANIEGIDLRGQGANALTIDDLFAAGATLDGVLSVLGDAGDTLALAGGWAKTASFALGGQNFDRYQATTPAAASVTAFVESQVQVTLL